MFDLEYTRGRALALASLLGAGLVMALSHWSPHFSWDVPVAHFVQRVPQSITPLFTFVTSLSVKPRVYFLAGGIIAVALVFGRWRTALSVAVGFLMMDGLENFLKPLVARPRPTPDLIRVWGQPQGFGSPSTTAIVYTFAAGMLTLLIWRKTRSAGVRAAALTGAVALAALGGVARIYLGAHWPSDILASYCTGILMLVMLGSTSESGTR